MQSRINQNLKAVIYMLIVFAMGVLYYFDSVYHKSFFLELLWCGYIFIYFDWAMSVKRKFTNRHIVKYLSAVCAMAVFFSLVMVFRYNFIDFENQRGTVSRLLWYLYYVPLLMMTQFMFTAALYIGKADGERISKRWRLLYIPSAILSLIVLTNNLHGLVFKLKYDGESWNGEYSYGILYYVIFAVICIYILALVFIVYRNYSVKARFIKRLWLPTLIVLFCVIYLIGFLNDTGERIFFLQRMFPLPVFICVSAIFYWESLVMVHLLPSNNNHYKYFMVSTLNAGITDNGFSPVLLSAGGKVYSPDILESALSSPVNVEENTVLKNSKINGGYFYHTEDITQINRINNDLIEKENYLEEENAMLIAANRLAEDKKRYEHQNIIYDKIAKSIKPQCDKIDALLLSSQKSEDEFNRAMKQIGIIGAYIKRYSNILLLSSENSLVSTAELKYAIEESVMYSRLAGIQATADIKQDVMLPCDVILYLYELFESAVEAAFPTLSSYSLSLGVEGDYGIFRLEIQSPSDLLPYETTNRSGGTVRVDSINGAEIITYRFLTGGDAL